MHCGCPLPGDTIGQKLKRLLASSKGTDVLLPPESNARAATHPSDHNAVFALHDMSASLQRREKRARKVEARRLRAERKGQIPAGNDRGVNHEMAFLYPVPMYYYYPGGCVAVAGGVVNGGLGCAVVSVGVAARG